MENLNFNLLLKKYKAQQKIDKLAKLYKNKKIAIYGAGQYSREVFQNYDLSGLNIIAVADAKFENPKNRDFYGYNCIKSTELGNIDCDVILIANFEYQRFIAILDDQILYRTKNEAIPVRPLIKPDFKDLFLQKKN